jgi:DNA-binding beta-propeller fold protein YncE
MMIGGWILAATAFVPFMDGQATVKVVDGIKVVTNGKRPAPPPGAAAKLVLEEIYAIAGGPPGPDFSDITALAVRPDGSVFVLDSKESRISAFDGKGKFRLSFGKKGQGPGELNTPVGISISPDNEVIVEDALNQRLAFFNLEGKFIRHLSTAKALGLTGVQMDAQGRIVARSMSLAEGGKLTMDVKTYDKDLNPKRTLASVEFGNPLQGKINPFSAMSLLYTLDGRGNLLMGSSKSYQIRFIDFEGNPARMIERDFDPVSVSQEDKDEMLKLIPNVGGVNVKDMIAWPDVFPPYGYFIVSDDGRLLVRTFEKGK